ncbi:MAG: hypothetical protein U0835_22010 [Isosphaeraceae bacterium]
MPLLDHFHPPLSRTHPWRGFHGAWAAAIARLLNQGVLPPRFYAVPFLDHDGPIEIDVATLKDAEAETSLASAGVRPSWKPPEPELSVAVEWPEVDDVRVEVLTEEGDPRVAAAVELVSPRNKDWPRVRDAFAFKCVEYLRHGCGVVVVDVVTSRRADLRAGLFASLGAEPPADVSPALSAASYRPAVRDGEGLLLAWPAALEVGRPLPTLPLARPRPGRPPGPGSQPHRGMRRPEDPPGVVVVARRGRDRDGDTSTDDRR